MDRPFSSSLSTLTSRRHGEQRESGRVIALAFAVLLILTGSSLSLAEEDAFAGSWSVVLVMTIVAVKLHLVGMYFMELKYSPALLKGALHFWILAVWLVTVVPQLTRG